LGEIQPGIVAVSGGIDSSVLAALIRKWELDFKGVFFSGPHLTKYEKSWARKILRDIGLDFFEIRLNLLNIREIKNNSKSRCYFCKKYIFKELKKVYPQQNIVEGSHLDDEKKFRPGEIALKELGILSPYKISKITKQDIKTLAMILNLKIEDFPSRPCLLTRFPYHAKISEELLSLIRTLEDFILSKGIKNFRIRMQEKDFFIHVSRDEKTKFIENQGEIMEFFVKKGIDQVDIKFLKDVSGFFDAK
jgi:uncharacterized protein